MSEDRRPACPAHPKARARATCAGCGLFLCEACGGGEPGARCARCRGAGHPVPWEDPARPRVGAFFATLKAMIDPGPFFALLPPTGGLRRPLEFAVLAGVIGAAFAALWGILGSLATGALLEPFVRSFLAAARVSPAEVEAIEGFLAAAPGIMLRLNLATLLLSPLFAALQVIVIAALTHPLARWSGGRGSFEATFRAVAYSSGAQVLHAVPQIGALAGLALRLILATIGLRRAHGVSTGRGFLLASWWIPVQIALGLLLLGLVLAVVAARVASR